jgi:dihydroorotate dehydrogenase electron transfer subunit
MTSTGIVVEAIVGAKTKPELVLGKKMSIVANRMYITTDDGSQGRQGTVLDELKEVLKEHEFDCVYACGPERMLYGVALLCKENGADCQLSLERYMKCGFGVCGSCDIGGKLVCKDGPVFKGEEALSFEEFGKSHRDGSGMKIEG